MAPLVDIVQRPCEKSSNCDCRYKLLGCVGSVLYGVRLKTDGGGLHASFSEFNGVAGLF